MRFVKFFKLKFEVMQFCDCATQYDNDKKQKLCT